MSLSHLKKRKTCCTCEFHSHDVCFSLSFQIRLNGLVWLFTATSQDFFLRPLSAASSGRNGPINSWYTVTTQGDGFLCISVPAVCQQANRQTAFVLTSSVGTSIHPSIFLDHFSISRLFLFTWQFLRLSLVFWTEWRDNRSRSVSSIQRMRLTGNALEYVALLLFVPKYLVI